MLLLLAEVWWIIEWSGLHDICGIDLFIMLCNFFWFSAELVTEEFYTADLLNNQVVKDFGL